MCADVGGALPPSQEVHHQPLEVGVNLRGEAITQGSMGRGRGAKGEDGGRILLMCLWNGRGQQPHATAS